MMKPITFYQWLAKTGQTDMDSYEPCQDCDGKGHIVYDDGYKARCEPCGGTGHALYQNYLKRVAADKKKLEQWTIRQMMIGAGV